MVYATKGRALKKEDMGDLWMTRIMAACEQHGVDFHTLRDSLHDCNIQLNRKVLSELAAWEPKTFEAIARIGRSRAIANNYASAVQGHLPDEPEKK